MAGSVYYYLFKGSWKDRFDELTSMIEKNKVQGFELWVPKDKARNHHLIILYGRPLTKTYCLVKNVWKSDNAIFLSYYEPNKEHFIINALGRGYPLVAYLANSVNINDNSVTEKIKELH